MLHNQPQKILIIASEFPPGTGGIGNQAFNLALYLTESNFNVTVLADIINSSKKEVDKAIPHNSFKFHPISRNKIVIITYFLRIQKAISLAKKNNIIIVSGKFSLWLVSVIKLFHPSKKIIAVVHGSELMLPKKWQRKLTNKNLLKCDSIIAVSNFTRSLLAPSILSKVKCFIIPNGINLDEFSGKARSLKASQPQQKNLQLITVGSVTERKGQANVINALPGIIKNYPGVIYHIIGTPVLKEKLSATINSKKLNEHVIFHDAVERKKLITLLSAADIKCMLSETTASGDTEGFGISILEANALGIPAIGSKNTGIEDAIKNNQTGILVDPKDVVEITNAVEKIMNNYNFFSTNAKQWALQHDWKIIIKKYSEVIEEVSTF